MAAPRETQPLATPGQSSRRPRLAHDPLSVSELLVWERMDRHQKAFVLPNYGDNYPGFVDDKGATQYADYQMVAWRDLDAQYIEVCYRKLPSQIVYSWEGYTNVPLPEVITTAPVVFFNTAQGDGTSSHPATQQASIFNGSGNGGVTTNPRGRAQASTSVMPDVNWVTAKPWAERIRYRSCVFQEVNPCTLETQLARCTTYLVGQSILTYQNCTISAASPGVLTLSGHTFSNGQTVMVQNVGGALPSPLTAGTIYYAVNSSGTTCNLSKTPGGVGINTTGGTGTQQVVIAVQPFPTFVPKSMVFTLFGMQANVAVDAETQAFADVSNSGADYTAGYNWGNGFSNDTSLTVKTVVIPPTLHPTLNLSSASDTVGPATASIDASSNAIVQGSNTLVAAITNSLSETCSASGSVVPVSQNATTPASIPTSGLYMIDSNVALHDDQLLFVHAVIVDFSVFNGTF